MKCSVLRKNLPKHLAANVFIALCNRSGRNACTTNIWKCFIYQVKTYINNAVINMPKWSMQRQLLKASETNDRLGEDWKKIFLEHFHKMSIFSQCKVRLGQDTFTITEKVVLFGNIFVIVTVDLKLQHF